MSAGGAEFFSDSSIQVGFAVQLATLLGFLGGFIMFLYKSITARVKKSIAEQIKPVDERTAKIEAKIDGLKMETAKEIAIREERDRERFRNLHDGQEFIKDQLKETSKTTHEAKKKLDDHLVEAATFIAKTETKVSGLQEAMIEFRHFMSRTDQEKRPSTRKSSGALRSSNYENDS